jgi:pyruvate/2-oxoglutarate dehydrogenase complex dihydrolipoamide dehydrogenase (E3) component
MNDTTQDVNRNSEEFDVVVLGSGEGGKYVAWTQGREGKRVAMIERRYVGGSCPNIACLPSKNVVNSAKAAWHVSNSERFGIHKTGFTVDMKGVRERKRKMVDDLVQLHLNNYKASATDLIFGTGTFVGPRTISVELNEGGRRIISGKQVVICVGTRAVISPIPGLAEARPMTHIEALELDIVPRHLLILGAGFVGLEFAQAMRRFGSEVTVIDRNNRVLHGEDEDISEGLEQLFADEGIRIIKEAQILEVEGTSGASVSLRYMKDRAENTIEGSHILVSTGRTPNTSGIGLEQAGVELAPNGYIKVNDRMQTSAPNVWAVGDCAGSPQFTHIAFDDFRIVRENMAGRTRTSTGRQVPFCLFTDPEFARVGLTEIEAKARNIPHRLVKIPMTRVLRAYTYSESRGFYKAILDESSDQILGFAAFGPEVSDVLGTIQMAMIAGLPYTAVRDAILTHPTMVEGLVVLFSAVPPRGA